jgi:hypothetical protein
VLEFTTAPPTDQTIRIWYKGIHDTLSTYDDEISGTIPDALAIDWIETEMVEYLMEKEGRISEEMMRRLQIRRGDSAQVQSANRIQSTNKPISKFLSIRDMDPR